MIAVLVLVPYACVCVSLFVALCSYVHSRCTAAAAAASVVAQAVARAFLNDDLFQQSSVLRVMCQQLNARLDAVRMDRAALVRSHNVLLSTTHTHQAASRASQDTADAAGAGTGAGAGSGAASPAARTQAALAREGDLSTSGGARDDFGSSPPANAAGAATTPAPRSVDAAAVSPVTRHTTRAASPAHTRRAQPSPRESFWARGASRLRASTLNLTARFARFRRQARQVDSHAVRLVVAAKCGRWHWRVSHGGMLWLAGHCCGCGGIRHPGLPIQGSGAAAHAAGVRVPISSRGPKVLSRHVWTAVSRR